MDGMPKPGDVLLGKYQIEHTLGVGGMGVVYAAQHMLLGKRVAMKLLLPEVTRQKDSVARFLNEARAAARLENEHVAQVLDVGQLENGLPFMVLEFLDGSDLAQVLTSRGPLPVAEVADHLLEAIDAVARAHLLGIIHRDLKPANLFLARRGDGSVRIKVLDFGISKATGLTNSGNITKTSSMLGSPMYMAPEQLRDSKSVDHRCDIWAFGVVAYELLTGQPPFDGDNAVALFAAIHEADPKSIRAVRPDVGVQLDAVVMKCLRRSPDERFASVSDLASCLVPFGTAAGAAAFESTRRAMPPSGGGAISGSRVSFSTGSGRLPQTPASSRDATLTAGFQERPTSAPEPPAMQTPHPPIYGQTSAEWARSQTRPGRSRGLAVGIAAGVVTLAVLGAAGVFLGPRILARTTAGKDPVADSRPAASAPAISAAEPVLGPSATPPVASTAPSTAAVTPPLQATAKKRPGPAATGTATAATVAAPTASAIATPPATVPKVSCTPPYELDADGKKHWKPECL